MASSLSFHPPFKCSKAIFVPEIYHSYESEMYETFNEDKGYDLYQLSQGGKKILKQIYKYIKGVSTTRPSFCSLEDTSNGEVLGMNTSYLRDKLKLIKDGVDKSTTIMVCYDTDNDNQPYSILLYTYDADNNSIYIVSVCADQTLLERSKGSGGLLINDLIDSVRSTQLIKSVFLHSVKSFVTGYEKKGFRKNGNVHDTMPEMVMDFENPDNISEIAESIINGHSDDVDSLASESLSENVSDNVSDNLSDSDVGNMKDVFIEVYNKKWFRGQNLRNTTSRTKYFEKKYPDFVSKGGKKYKKTKKRNLKNKKSCKKTKKRNCKKKKI
jgi:hypothetical protein